MISTKNGGIFPSTNGYTSATTENSPAIQGSADSATILVLSIRDESASWSGTIKVAARGHGEGTAGKTDFVDHIELKNRDTGAVVDGDTGAAAAGIFECNIAGLEVQIQHARTAGTVGVYPSIVYG